jgi:predicted DNA-binding ribbon-helix-helix protein
VEKKMRTQKTYAELTQGPDKKESKLVQEHGSSLVSKNVTVAGRRTSIRLEPEMWGALRDISRREGSSLHDICSAVYLRKLEKTSLTAAIRVFLLQYYRAAATEDGHFKAGHGNMRRRSALTETRWRLTK